MEIAVLGLHYKSAPIEIREILSFGKEELEDAYRLLLAKEDVLECVIVSTCNRVEIYAVMTQPSNVTLRQFMLEFHDISEPLDPHLYYHEGQQAIVYLARVACGLESMVLGEPQIFGQIKDAYQSAVQYQGAKTAFRTLFPQVFSLVKKVRAKTRIGENHVSVSSVAIAQAEQILKSFTGKKVMVLGTGQMGEQAVRGLKEHGAGAIWVVNRTFQHAVDVAERYGGTAVMLHELPEYFPRADIIISSIGGGRYFLESENVERFRAGHAERPLLLLDIAVPRSIDPAVGELPNVHLYNIDDLKKISDDGLRVRQKEAQKAMAMITDKSDEILEGFYSSDIVPTLLAIRQKAEIVRSEGLEDELSKIPISFEHRKLVENMTRSIVNRILFQSEAELRHYVNRIRSH